MHLAWIPSCRIGEKNPGSDAHNGWIRAHVSYRRWQGKPKISPFHNWSVAELLFDFHNIPEATIVSSVWKTTEQSGWGRLGREPPCQGLSVVVWHSQGKHGVASVVVHWRRGNMLGLAEGRIRLRRKKANFTKSVNWKGNLVIIVLFFFRCSWY